MMKPPLFGPGQRIGLFGGSFNPAHYGHYMVALYALKRLQLDWVWWLVSPQNPLKDPRETGEYDERLKLTKLVARHPRFVVTDLERQVNSRNTAETLLALNQTDEAGKLHLDHGGRQFCQFAQLASLDRYCASPALGLPGPSRLFHPCPQRSGGTPLCHLPRQNRSGRKTCHAKDARLGIPAHALAARKLNRDSKLEPTPAKL